MILWMPSRIPSLKYVILSEVKHTKQFILIQLSLKKWLGKVVHSMYMGFECTVYSRQLFITRGTTWEEQRRNSNMSQLPLHLEFNLRRDPNAECSEMFLKEWIISWQEYESRGNRVAWPLLSASPSSNLSSLWNISWGE